MTMLLSATTLAPFAVSATFVAARPLALRARAPLLDRLRLAAPAALSLVDRLRLAAPAALRLVVRYLLLLPRTPGALSTAIGNLKASLTATILTPRLLRRTSSALTKSFLTPTSITSVTPRPALPSCHALPSSFLSLSPTPMSKPTSFCFYVWLLGAYSHFRSENFLSGGLLFSLMLFLFACLCLEG